MNKRLVGVAIAVLVLTGLGITLGAGQSHHPADPLQTQARDEPAPALSGRTLAGGRFDLAALHGQVVLVNVWASWCDPCRRELPALAAAQRRWSGDGFRVAGIDMRDNDESAHRLLSDVGAAGLTSVADPQGTLAVAWGVRGVPESFLVDRSGRIRWWTAGTVDANWLEQRVPALLTS